MESGRNQYSSPVENVPQGFGQKSRDQAASAVGLSGKLFSAANGFVRLVSRKIMAKACKRSRICVFKAITE